MPHLTITCSANLADSTDLTALAHLAHAVLMDSGLFEPGAPRVRVLISDHYAIADLDPRNSFAALTLQMAQGRPESARRALGDALMAAIAARLAPLLDERHFALSLEIVETPPGMSWKRNSIHDRLRGQ